MLKNYSKTFQIFYGQIQAPWWEDKRVSQSLGASASHSTRSYQAGHSSKVSRSRPVCSTATESSRRASAAASKRSCKEKGAETVGLYKTQREDFLPAVRRPHHLAGGAYRPDRAAPWAALGVPIVISKAAPRPPMRCGSEATRITSQLPTDPTSARPSPLVIA